MDFEFLGPYKIESTLGRGGMGTVYKGVHAKSGEPVAVKVIASVLADQERFRRRFAAEVETLKRLRHPNIVQLIGYGEEQGHLFYSMEYVAGVSLQELLKKEKRLHWKRVIEIATDVCGALKQAHDLGIIHRDLKPANIMISESGQVKLTDFGIAKLFGSSDVTAAGAVIGTADFMPPEQAEGKPVTTRSDLYAVGSLAYAALAGRAPFGGRSVPEVLYAVRYNAPLPLASLVPDTPDELVELIEELLQKDPNSRPPTALVVSNRLKALKAGLQRREDMAASSQLLEKAEKSKELTSIDLDSLAEDDLRLKSLQLEKDQTKVVSRSDGTQLGPPSAVRPTRDRQVAGPEESTQLATPSALDADFVDNTSSERVVGQTHFTEVEEEDRGRSTYIDSSRKEGFDWAQWISIGALSMILIGCIAALLIFTRPKSADAIYDQIIAAVDSGDDSQLMDVEPLLDELEDLYPDDPRLEQLQPLRKDVQLIRTTRKLLRRARTDGGTENLDPIEQAFLDCYQARSLGNAQVTAKLDALFAVFAANDSLPDQQKKLIELARYMQEQIRKQPQSLTHRPRNNSPTKCAGQRLNFLQNCERLSIKESSNSIKIKNGRKPSSSRRETLWR